MSFDAYANVELQVREGVTLEKIQEVVAPLLERWDLEVVVDDSIYETGVSFRPDSGDLHLQVTWSVSDRFFDDVFQPVIRALGELVDEPFEAVLKNDSTGSDDNTWRVVAGPADKIPEFEARSATYEIGDQLRHIVPPPGSKGLSMAEASSADTLEVALAGEEDSPARLNLNLMGLELTKTQREDIAALVVLIGRTLAAKDQALVLSGGALEPADEPAPGPRG